MPLEGMRVHAITLFPLCFPEDIVSDHKVFLQVKYECCSDNDRTYSRVVVGSWLSVVNDYFFPVENILRSSTLAVSVVF